VTDLAEIKNGLLAEIVERVGGDPIATMADIRTGLETLWHDANTSGDQQKAELVNSVWERAQQLSTANNMLIDVTAAAREALKMTKDEYEKIVNALNYGAGHPEVEQFAQQLEADVIEITYANNFVSEEPGWEMIEEGGLGVLEEMDAQVFFDLLFQRNGHQTTDEEKGELEDFITDFVNRYTERIEADKQERDRAWKAKHEPTD
jgi:hypothetical protein